MGLFGTFIGAAALNEVDTAKRRDMDQQHEAGLQEDRLKHKDDLINIQNQHIEILKRQADTAFLPSSKERTLEEENQDLKRELKEYKELLSKPMLEIAQQNNNFKETYQKQQSLLANWIASQRAYKELAMQYGKELGKEPQEVLAESEETKKVVLENKSELGNNVDPKVAADLDYENKKKAEEKRKEKITDQILRDMEERRQKRMTQQS